jgi:predicted nucleotidyltransferase
MPQRMTFYGSTMKTLILKELNAIEALEDVRIVCACESGSRAWGAFSGNSEYDVRFIYLHRQQWYLSRQPGRDVIELAIKRGLDISGWDLRKALRLFGHSSPALLEWLQSPLVYREIPEIMSQLRALVPTVYARERAWHYYFHGVRRFRQRYVGGEYSLKLFFRVLRFLLAAMWIREQAAPPPMTLQDLADVLLPPGLHQEMRRLLQQKGAGSEMNVAVVGPLWDFVEVELGRLTAAQPHFHRTWPPMDQMNIIFRRFLQIAWQTEQRQYNMR